MPDAKVDSVAEYLIGFSQEHGDPISNLKLQKLLYYAQGWHLALKDRPLFGESIQAWPYGPVVPRVYGRFKKYSWNPIGDNFATQGVDLSGPVKEHLDEIMAVYGSLTAYHLEMLTHQETPWLKARGGLGPGDPSNAVISTDDMRAFFKSV